LKLAFDGKPNALRYVHGRNWLYVLQRVDRRRHRSSFLLTHLWELRVQKWLYGMSSSAFFDTLAEHLSARVGGVPLSALLYTVGLGAAVFHLGNGLVGFCLSWGVVVSRRAQRTVALFATGLSVGLFALGMSTGRLLRDGNPSSPHRTIRARSPLSGIEIGN